MATADQRRAARRNGSGHVASKPTLNELGEKIFLDRYALKDMTKQSLAVGDTVIVCVNQKTRQREIGTVLSMGKGRVSIELRDGTVTEQGIEDVDKPLETHPGQMMDRVARGIAAIETSPDKQGEWEGNFRWLLDDWRFVPGGRILTAAGTDQQLTFFNCLPPEQEILTATGYKPIAEVQIGDQVVTHRNRLRSVLHKFERETEEPLYIIKTKKLGYDDLRVTGEHKVLVIRSDWVNTHRSRDGLRLAQDPQWIVAKDLRPGDYLAAAYNGEQTEVAPIYVSEYVSGYDLRDDKLFKPQQRSEYRGHLTAGGTHHDVTNRLVIDHDLCYLFGRWLGDGNVNHRSQSDIPSGIKIVFGLDEREEAEQIATIIEAKFGVKTHLKVSSTERWLDLWANSMVLGQFFKAFFGCYSYSKQIPAQLQQLPHDLSVALLKGLFTADGYISDNKLGILLSNRTLATQVHQQLLRLGYLFSIKENTHRLGRHPAYRIQATANECGALFKDFFGVEAPPHEVDLKYYFEHDGLRWLRIDEIAIEDYTGIVLDIEVDEDHSFVSAGVVVSNCYVVPSPQDSRRGIVDTLSQMMEIMSRGGGVGINLSSLRPQHAYVKGVNGRSSGSVSWGGLYSFVTGLIEQGGSRRGALMLILNVWHPDVLSFINSKREAGKITNANISVGLTDAFMDAVNADAEWDLVFPDPQHPTYNEEWDGDLEKWRAAGKPVNVHKTIKARELWNNIIESAWASAEPGLWFIDRANKMSNSHYFSPLICTNPCVTGDTLLYTGEGLIRARELFERGGNVATVIDGRFGHTATTTSATHVFRTGTKQVYRLQTKEGYFVRATADHRIMTPRGWTELQHLQSGDKVHILNRKGGFGSSGSLELGRTLGWLIGDGTIKQDRAVLSFFGAEKQELAPLFAAHVNTLVAPLTATQRIYNVGVVAVAGRDEARVQSERLLTIAAEHGLTATKHVVPDAVLTGSEAMQRGFLQALFTADGSFQDGGVKGGSIRLAANEIGLLEGVQQLLLNFGIASRIYRNRRDADFRSMPDGQGGLKDYWCEAQHELAISRHNMVVFAQEIGFLMEYKQIGLADYVSRGKRGPYAEHFTATVESITEDGIEDVYDLTEPLTHSFVANGLVVHNCGEQPLPAWGICNLGAINLSKFVQNNDVAWDDLRQAVRYGVRFLDNVIDATPYFFEENRNQQMNERRVGLGIMGLADMLIRLGIRYGSDECITFLDQLGEVIATEAYLASTDNAAEKGSFTQFDAEKLLQSGYMQAMPEYVRQAVRDKGLRNVTLLTVAPTGTTGTMVGTSTGVEPYFSWSYFRKSRLGVHEERVAIVEEWEQAHPGQPLPPFFVNAMELSPREHVNVQAAIQRWVDSAISKTCNVPGEYTVEQTRELYEYMYKMGCKGGTIYRDGSRDEQVLNLKKDEAKKAEAQPVAESGGQKLAELWNQPKIRPRPKRSRGVTVQKHSPLGSIFVTVNDDDEGEPLEVFVTAGKAGSDVTSMAEAMGRLASLVLRVASPLTPKERLNQIVSQLKGIGGARSTGFGKDRVRSLPDAVAQAIEECCAPDDQLVGDEDTAIATVQAPLQLALPSIKADLCPSCGEAAFVHEEGCMHCNACGYSAC
jgi:ribonucleoside-diphosphate reductase alpha chain